MITNETIKYCASVQYSYGNISGQVFDLNNKLVILTEDQQKKLTRIAYKKVREIEFLKEIDDFYFDLDENFNLISINKSE